ncbi:DUF742 domain-containing protein [Nocardia rhamnosiphila]|uniref:DUF742 domain-containing protein n=1 Tax=Nocardia flavorosea TaxID=53429 RepID=A0A846Y9X8_9NOCA|nr:DUF742 domain-containing protein [Nocardia flavorosea]NKY54594.1 DUF742 domain-containing protein [Nocardia flavorosea]
MSANDGIFSPFDDDPGPLVRPFAVTRGRAGRDLHNLDLLTLVVTVQASADDLSWDREYGEILRMCHGRPQSIVEIAARLDLMVAAVKVLISDLINSGHVIFRSPPKHHRGPDLDVIQAVLEGVRKL